MNSSKRQQFSLSYFNQESSACNGIENVSIIVNKKRLKKCKRLKVFKYARQPSVAYCLSCFRTSTKQDSVTRHFSTPDINKRSIPVQAPTRSVHAIQRSQSPFESKFIVNVVSEHRFDKCMNPHNYRSQNKWKIYRCQLNAHEDTCCCACTSEAMFEVMKGLYNCYKKKNCDHCKCVLCGHLQKEERLFGELRKSMAFVGLDTASAKERKDKIKKAEKALEGKTPTEKEKFLREMAKTRQPLPEGKTQSEKALINKIRNDLGLPPEAKTASDKTRMRKAEAAGLITPLDGKTPEQKKKILKAQAALGIPLPEGRTPSEKALIQKVKAGTGIPEGIPSERFRKARAAGVITPLEGKTPEQKEKILKGLAMHGLPLPDGKTPSEKIIVDKIRADLGLPPEPKSKAMKDKYANAINAGFLQPLEGKSPKEKENILQGLANLAIPLPEGRTPSEKALVAKVKARTGSPLEDVTLSQKNKKAKAAGFITPLKGKTPQQREKILKSLAIAGIPLPEGQTPSEKKMTGKVRTDLGLPIEPPSKAVRDKHHQAAKLGLLQPLEGKTPQQKEKILQGLHDMGIPLPIGRTPSEKALIAKIKAGFRAPSLALAPSEKMRRAKAEGILTPLKGKTPAQKEKILKGLAKHGLPLPEGQSPSEKQLIDKISADLGLPPEPKTPEMRDKYAKAADAGILQPLEDKSPAQKEKILQGLHDMGIPLPEGRTASEKSLIAKVKARPRALSLTGTKSEKMPKAEAAGLISPAEKKKESPAQIEYRPELDEKTAKIMKEGKGPADECICDVLTPEFEKKPSLKRVTKSENLRAAKAAGVITPLEGKLPEQKEKILKGLAKYGVPLPEGKTASEKQLIDKVRAEVGLPPEPKTPAIKEKYAKAQAAGLITPLEGKSPEQKEKILKAQAAMGLPLPEGRTPSEKALIAAIKKEPPPSITTEKIQKAKAAGLLTPLAGKTPQQKENILKGLAKAGLSLPEGRTPSEKALINQVKKEFAIPEKTPSEKLKRAKAAGLLTPLEGKTPAQKEKILRGRAAAGLPLPIGKSPSKRALIQKIKDDAGYITPSLSEKLRKAKAAGLLSPLKGKSPAQKEKIVKEMIAAGVPIPEGETPSEKALINRLIAEPPLKRKTRSERIRAAKTDGLLTPLQGKTPEQKKNILKGLVKAGLPLPEPHTPSEQNLIDNIREEVGLPLVPTTPSLQEKYNKALAAGIITPLEGKTPSKKEQILKRLHDAAIPLPKGRTASEKSMIKRVKDLLKPSRILSGKMRKAKAADLLTPLDGKSPEQKEKNMRELVEQGLPLPEVNTTSQKKIAEKIRKELGLPPAPKTPSMKERHDKATAAGVLVPLEGLTPAEKEKVLRAQADLGVPLPEGRTASEKALIAKIKAETAPSKISSAKLRKGKAAGLLTPLEGKTPAEKEKIIRGLAEIGLPLPEGKTPSEKSLIHKVRTELGIPPPAKTSSEKSIVRKAKAEGLFTPITGKSPAEKERILRGLAEAGLPLPVGKTPSEKDLIKKVRAEAGMPPKPTPSEKMGKIKRKSKKIGAEKSRIWHMNMAKAVGVEGTSGDIIKAETCDRGCGCDKKKLRFKHSYVKIRVTSPDISALCPCPGECIPGSKAGAFIDNEGIKVTVGEAIGIPVFPMEYSSDLILEEIMSNNDQNIQTDNLTKYSYTTNTSTYKVHSSETGINSTLVYNPDTSSSDLNPSTRAYSTESENILQSSTPHYEGGPSRSVRILGGMRRSGDIYRSPMSKSRSVSSVDSIILIKSETSLSLNTNASNTMDTMTDMSITSTSALSFISTHYSGYQLSDDILSISSLEGPRKSDALIEKPKSIQESENKEKLGDGTHQDEYMIFRMCETRHNNYKRSKLPESDEPSNQLATKLDVNKVLEKILRRKHLFGASSMFIVIPTSDDELDVSPDVLSFTTSIQSSNTNTNMKLTKLMDSDSAGKCSTTNRKKYLRHNEYEKNTISQFKALKEESSHVIGTDTSDRPCYCCPKRPASTTMNQSCSSRDQCIANVLSRRFTQLFLGGEETKHIGKRRKSSCRSRKVNQN